MSIILAHSDVSQINQTPTPKKSRGGGPKTEEGKASSRRNALKQGLRSKIIFPEELADIVDQRVIAFSEEFAPRCGYEEVLIRDMAVSSARFERCASLSVADLMRVAERAADCWEIDRKMSVENYAAKLSRDPAKVACGLRRSCQGVDWLIDRWEGLGAIARTSGGWDDDQRTLAFDMMGVTHELRGLSIEVPEGDDTEGLITLVEAQLKSLRDDQDSVLINLSDAEQAMTMAGMPLEEDAATARLRKDERRARGDFAKALKELLRFRAEHTMPEKPRSLPTTDRPPISAAASEQFVKRLNVPAQAIEETVLPDLEDESPTEHAPAERIRTRRARKELARRARESSRRERVEAVAG